MKYINGFNIIGISVRTTNKDGRSATDLGNLWKRFYGEGLSGKIPNRSGNDIYSIYTDYESNYTGAYTAIIGMKVTSLETIPAGMVGKAFPAGNFLQFIAKGPMPGAIMNTWKEIWKKDNELHRKYIYDFEVYGDRSKLVENAEVDIYISV
jgi:predicted transcriptional regulator YdeE